MLMIRKAQLDVFEHAARQRFEDDVVAHLRDFAPTHTKALGEEGVRQVIRLGMGRSANYGFTLRGPVQFYIELMFMLGSAFDSDPQLPWAAEALGDPEVLDEMDRADLLHAHALKYTEAVGGPNAAYTREALRRLGREEVEHVPHDELKFEQYALSLMQEIYPQKWA